MKDKSRVHRMAAIKKGMSWRSQTPTLSSTMQYRRIPVSEIGLETAQNRRPLEAEGYDFSEVS